MHCPTGVFAANTDNRADVPAKSLCVHQCRSVVGQLPTPDPFPSASCLRGQFLRIRSRGSFLPASFPRAMMVADSMLLAEENNSRQAKVEAEVEAWVQLRPAMVVT